MRVSTLKTNKETKHNLRVWGKMRTIAQETAPQIALRNCSKEAVGEGQYICDFSEGGVHKIKHIILQISASHN